MFKLTSKQMMLFLVLGFVIAFMISGIATWMDWRVNPNGLFYDDTGIHWSIMWETLSSWLWPLWLVLVALGYVGLILLRLVSGWRRV